jgi:hypothetical protein
MRFIKLTPGGVTDSRCGIVHDLGHTSRLSPVLPNNKFKAFRIKHFMVLTIHQGLFPPKQIFFLFFSPPQIHFWRKPDEWN